MPLFIGTDEVLSVQLVDGATTTDVDAIEFTDSTGTAVVWNRTPPIDLSGIPDTIFDIQEQGYAIPKAGYRLVDSGKHYQAFTFRQVEILPEWLVRGAYTDYEVQMQFISGTSLISGSAPTDTWLDIASLYWQNSRSGIGINVTELNLQLRHKASQTLIAEKAIRLETEVETP